MSVVDLSHNKISDLSDLHTRIGNVSKLGLAHNQVVSLEGVYCTVVLYCTVLYCTILYCIILYCTILYCTILDWTVLYCTVLCVLYCTSLCCMVLYLTVPYYSIVYCSVLYCTILYHVYNVMGAKRTMSVSQGEGKLGTLNRQF